MAPNNFEFAQSASQPLPFSRKNSFPGATGAHRFSQPNYPPSPPNQPQSSDEQSQEESQQAAFLASLEYPAWKEFEHGKPYDCIERELKRLDDFVPKRSSGRGQIPGHGIGQEPAPEEAAAETNNAPDEPPEEIQRSKSGEVPAHGPNERTTIRHGADEIIATPIQVAGQGSYHLLTRTSSYAHAQPSAEVIRRSSTHAAGQSWGPVPGHGIGQIPRAPSPPPAGESANPAPAYSCGPKKVEPPWTFYKDAKNTEKYLQKHKDGEGRIFLRLKDTPPDERKNSPDEIDIWVNVGTIPSVCGVKAEVE
ncbi:hypothetical protein, conserved [Eimeria brunetti]|uniref:Uncharacterized protein n=1 Tax=Eimeria brunetti TaxID=51314 RepID=U6LQE9_9EIME|nr:hypothetical protein, conserved [Eimeria brunetti]